MWFLIVIIVCTGGILVALGMYGLRQREPVFTGCAGCGTIGAAILVLFVAASLSVFACADNPCGNTFEVLWEQASGVVIASLASIMIGSGLLAFAAPFLVEGRTSSEDDRP